MTKIKTKTDHGPGVSVLWPSYFATVHMILQIVIRRQFNIFITLKGLDLT